MKKWSENDELFLAECQKGHGWERYVAMFFALQGLDSRVGEQTLRDSIKQAGEYANTVDVYCERCRIEVKSRDVVFYRPEDFPFETILVDTVAGWEAKDPPPHMVVCVSQKTGSLVALNPRTTKHAWTQERRYDNVRRIEDWFYEAPRELWQPIDKLAEALRKIKVCRPAFEENTDEEE